MKYLVYVDKEDAVSLEELKGKPLYNLILYEINRNVFEFKVFEHWITIKEAP